MSAYLELFHHDQYLKGIIPPGKPAGCSSSDGGSHFSGFNLTSASISGASFNGSQFNSCNFSGASISGSRFADVQFRNCHFNGTNITSTNFVNCTFEGCKFSHANLMQVKISRSKMNNTSFHNVHGRYVDWKNSFGTHSNWNGCDIRTGG